MVSTTLPKKVAMGKTVLLVDDERRALRALSRVLHPMRPRIWFAEDGGDALRLVRKFRPDLIFLDLHMPGMSGFDLMRQMREEGLGELPVIIVTGDQRQEALIRGLGEGCVYFLTKPFRNEQVLRIAEYLIGDLPESERERLEPLL